MIRKKPPFPFGEQKLFSNNPGDSPSTIWAIVVFQHWWKKYLSN